MGKNKKPKDKLFNNHNIKIFFDEEGDYLAHLEDLPGISAFGKTPQAAIHELSIAWSAARKTYLDMKKSMPNTQDLAMTKEAIEIYQEAKKLVDEANEIIKLSGYQLNLLKIN